MCCWRVSRQWDCHPQSHSIIPAAGVLSHSPSQHHQPCSQLIFRCPDVWPKPVKMSGATAVDARDHSFRLRMSFSVFKARAAKGALAKPLIWVMHGTLLLSSSSESLSSLLLWTRKRTHLPLPIRLTFHRTPKIATHQQRKLVSKSKDLRCAHNLFSPMA